MQGMNIKTNILFFVKNTISRVKRTNQGYHYNKQHHEKAKQLHIYTKDDNFPVQEKVNKANSIKLITYSDKRVDRSCHTMSIGNFKF